MTTNHSAPTYFFARAGRAGPHDLLVRVPELTPLHNATVAVIGLGSIGAPVALELARAQIGNLRLLDFDFVDPGSIVRWPLGLAIAGVPKTEAVRSFIARDYPYTKVTVFHRKLGIPHTSESPSDYEVMERITADIDLLIDTAADSALSYFLSDYCHDIQLPYIAISGTPGGWGGRVARLIPGKTGCWYCLMDHTLQGTIPTPPAMPEKNPFVAVQPAGCGDPTFTGAGFDMTSVAMIGTRTAVATLCRGQQHAYPDSNTDVAIIAFRDDEGRAIPQAVRAFDLLESPNCPRCSSDT